MKTSCRRRVSHADSELTKVSQLPTSEGRPEPTYVSLETPRISSSYNNRSSSSRRYLVISSWLICSDYRVPPLPPIPRRTLPRNRFPSVGVPGLARLLTRGQLVSPPFSLYSAFAPLPHPSCWGRSLCRSARAWSTHVSWTPPLQRPALIVPSGPLKRR